MRAGTPMSLQCQQELVVFKVELADKTFFVESHSRRLRPLQRQLLHGAHVLRAARWHGGLCAPQAPRKGLGPPVHERALWRYALVSAQCTHDNGGDDDICARAGNVPQYASLPPPDPKFPRVSQLRLPCRRSKRKNASVREQCEFAYILSIF